MIPEITHVSTSPIRELDYLRETDPSEALNLLLSHCQMKISPKREVYLESTIPEFPYILTSLGLTFSREDQSFLSFPFQIKDIKQEGSDYHFGNDSQFIKKQFLHTAKKDIPIALKYIGKKSHKRPTGIMALDALNRLTGYGVRCVNPLMASDEVIITEWVDGDLPQNSMAFEEFIQTLRKIAYSLRTRGNFPYQCHIDEKPDNYRVLNEQAYSPLERYIVIDPIYFVDPTNQFMESEFPIGR